MLYQEARTRKEGLHTNGSDEVVSSRKRNLSSSHQTVKNSAKLDALRRDAAFIKYLAQLEQSNYFEGGMKDSQRWKQKEQQAVKMWVTMRQAELVPLLALIGAH
jgi:hypothetical protein